MMSDFEMPPLNEELSEEIKKIKQKVLKLASKRDRIRT